MSEMDPRTKAEILEAIERLADEEMHYWEAFDGERFAAPIGDAWSPADNVRHLIKSTRPLVKALGLPRVALRTMFGSSDAPSRSYSEVRAVYHAALAQGGDAGSFAPSPEAPPVDPDAWQSELVASCRDVIGELARSVERWQEEDLDRYRLPHPLIGKLTVREMLLFTLYHYAHHRGNVERRLGAAGEAG